ncbi:AAA family ATPase [Geothrix paludis]|uniref:AAA family ATPase n=1 Tax=Geothrix paludis TaxID=2922722 RepID=UPI001FADF88C|nr:AAA family ATPase [Geothrix paludis]
MDHPHPMPLKESIPPPRRRLVLVSGAPGAGKTTLAVPLAAALVWPLFSKDFLKETLVEALEGPNQELAFSRQLGGAAMELLWKLAAFAPAAVLEANFRPHSSHERERLRALTAEVVEVFCDCGAAEAARRFALRAAAGAHAAHPLRELPPDLLKEYDGPVGAGVVIRVDTSMPVDIASLASQVKAAFASAGGPPSSDAH